MDCLVHGVTKSWTWHSLLGSIPGWEDPWRRAWQPTPVFLPGESAWTRAWQDTVQGSESDTTEWLSTQPQDPFLVVSCLPADSLLETFVPSAAKHAFPTRHTFPPSHRCSGVTAHRWPQGNIRGSPKWELWVPLSRDQTCRVRLLTTRHCRRARGRAHSFWEVCCSSRWHKPVGFSRLFLCACEVPGMDGICLPSLNFYPDEKTRCKWSCAATGTSMESE